MLQYLLTGFLFLGSNLPSRMPQTSAAPPMQAYSHSITVWVPPYAVAQSQAQLKSPGVREAITHLDLQFWEPKSDGSVQMVKEPEVDSTVVNNLRDWAHLSGIRAMLCVFNGEAKWDWPLAKAAFGSQALTFVKGLVSEVDRYALDGIDIDLEGPAQYEGDKPAFLAFMSTLSKELRAKGKQLTVDSFCYVWNAPNQGWWNDLFPLVDGINCMGYEETGCAATEWRSYASLKKAAGANASKLLIGVPSNRAKWQGSSLQDQIDWIKVDGTMGLAIWDAQLPDIGWKSPHLLQSLLAISSPK